MPRIFAITSAIDEVTLDAQGRAEAVFTVTNSMQKPLRVQLRIKPSAPAQATWISIAGDLERDLPADGTMQVGVSIAIPSGTPPGKYTFRLDVASVENPDEDYTEGPGVTLNVKEAAPPPPRPFPWWIVAVALVGLLLVGGGVTWYLLNHDQGTVVQRVLLPSMKGKNIDQARRELEGLAFMVQTTSVFVPDPIPPGTVIDQEPQPGGFLPKGTRVTLSVKSASP